MSAAALLAVVLSGGSGTRLWPVSREALPKPFMRIGDGPSLLSPGGRNAASAIAAAARLGRVKGR